MKWFAGISILLNIALVGFLIQAALDPVDDSSPAEESQPVDIVTRTVFQTNFIDVAAEEQAAPRFTWALVESESFEEYMANLRRLECPEWLVKMIILNELEEHYDDQEQQLRREQPPNHWVTYRERRTNEREYENTRLELLQEERGVMRLLTGSYFSEGGMNVVSENELMIVMLIAELSFEQAVGIASEMFFINEFKERRDSLQLGFLTPADVEELRRNYRGFRTVGESIVGPSVMEELFLRLQFVFMGISNEFSMPGVHLTGRQLRQLVKVRSSYWDPFEAEYLGDDQPSGREMFEINEEVTLQIALELGTDVAEQYQRSQNRAFRDIHNFTESNDLPEETAVAVFEVRQSAIDQVRKIMTDPAYDAGAKSEMRQLIQIEIERQLQETMGANVYESYRGSEGVWIDRVGGSVPTDDAPPTGGGR